MVRQRGRGHLVGLAASGRGVCCCVGWLPGHPRARPVVSEYLATDSAGGSGELGTRESTHSAHLGLASRARTQNMCYTHPIGKPIRQPTIPAIRRIAGSHPSVLRNWISCQWRMSEAKHRPRQRQARTQHDINPMQFHSLLQISSLVLSLTC